MTTPYVRAIELNEMGIPSITVTLKAFWSESQQKWMKDKESLAKSLPNSTFLGKKITEYTVEDCKMYLEKRGKTAKNANCVVMLTNPQSPIMAIDVDDGCEEFTEESLFGNELPPTHKTLNNGIHYIFKKDERTLNWSNTWNNGKGKKGDKGYIGGDIKHDEGFIISPPTYLKDNKNVKYEFSYGEDFTLDTLRTLTKDEFQYFDTSVRKKISPKKLGANDRVGCDIDELQKALSGIDIDKPNLLNGLTHESYNSWLMIMCCIHTETNGHPDGLTLFLEWSKTLKVNKKLEQESTWVTLKPQSQKKLTIGTLFKLSEYKGKCINIQKDNILSQGSFDMKDEYCITDFRKEYLKGTLSNGKEVEECLSKLSRVAAYIDQGKNSFWVLKDRCTTTFKGKPITDIMYQMYDPPRIRLYVLGVVDKQGELVPFDIASLWHYYFTSMPFYNKVVYEPTMKVKDSFNLWAGFRAKLLPTFDKKKFHRWSNHIFEVWANGCPKAYDYIINWFKWIIQNPSQKTGKVILLIDLLYGSGKGTITEHFRECIFGRRHSACLQKTEEMLGQFNSAISHKNLIELPELPTSKEDFHKFFATWKTLITDGIVNINEKNMRARPETSYHNFICSSNSDHCLPLIDGDRRFVVLQTNGKYKNNDKYFTALHKDLNDEEITNHIFTYLMTDPITIDIVREPPFVTDIKIEMQQNNEINCVTFVKEFKYGMLNAVLNAQSKEVHEIEGWFPRFLVCKNKFDDDEDTHDAKIKDLLDLKNKGIKSMKFLYSLYKDWCKDVNCKCYTQIVFAKKVKDKINHKHKKDGEYYKCWGDDD